VLQQVVAFGGEADAEQRAAAGALALRHGGQDVGVLGEGTVGGWPLPSFLIFCSAGRRPPVGDRGRGDEDVGAPVVSASVAASISRADFTSTRRTPRGVGQAAPARRPA
jgi:hypothetical protein